MARSAINLQYNIRGWDRSPSDGEGFVRCLICVWLTSWQVAKTVLTCVFKKSQSNERELESFPWKLGNVDICNYNQRPLCCSWRVNRAGPPVLSLTDLEVTCGGTRKGGAAIVSTVVTTTTTHRHRHPSPVATLFFLILSLFSSSPPSRELCLCSHFSVKYFLFFQQKKQFVVSVEWQKWSRSALEKFFFYI